MKSLFPYVGGKHRLAPRLIKLFPDHRCYVEVFGGALNLLFAKPPSDTEVVNDVNSNLTRLFRVIRFHPDEFLKELTLVTHNRAEFMDYHTQPGLTDIQRAARFWYLLKTTYGGTGSVGHKNFGYGPGKSALLKSSALATVLDAHQRLDGVYIENLDFADLVARYDRGYTFFFCDPPYFQAADYGVPFEYADHQRLAQTLKKIKGKFLLTIGDHPQIRPLYKGLPQRKISVTYTVSRKKSPAAQKHNELIIANYPLPRGVKI